MPTIFDKAVGTVGRGFLVGTGYTLALTIVGMIVKIVGIDLPDANAPLTSLLWTFVGGTMMGLFLGPIASSVLLSRIRHILVWSSVVLFNLVSVIIEGYIFAPILVGDSLIGSILQQILVAFITGWVITVLFTSKGVAISAPPTNHSFLSWSWHFAVSAMSYLFFYFIFSTLNFALVTGPYYKAHAGGLEVPVVNTILTAEFIRSGLITLSILLFLLNVQMGKKTSRPAYGFDSLFCGRSRSPDYADQCSPARSIWLKEILMFRSFQNSYAAPIMDRQIHAEKLNGVSTIDFHVTAKCKQACPYCWGPRRFRNPLDTVTAQSIIARIWELGVRRIVFTGGDPLYRADTPELIRFAKEVGLETALSTTGDFVTPEILEHISPHLDLISLPLDGSTEEANSKTKHRGHYSAVMRSLNWLRSHPSIDVKVCTPVTHHNLNDVPNIARLVDEYSYTTQARVFYNVFQAFPRAMFKVDWEKLIVSDEEFSALKDQVGAGKKICINFLSHETLDKLYVMVFPDGSMTIPRGGEYLNFGPFLEVKDFEQVFNVSQFDSAKHLRHSRGWGKETITIRQALNVNQVIP